MSCGQPSVHGKHTGLRSKAQQHAAHRRQQDSFLPIKGHTSQHTSRSKRQSTGDAGQKEDPNPRQESARHRVK